MKQILYLYMGNEEIRNNNIGTSAFGNWAGWQVSPYVGLNSDIGNTGLFDTDMSLVYASANSLGNMLNATSDTGGVLKTQSDFSPQLENSNTGGVPFLPSGFNFGMSMTPTMDFSSCFSLDFSNIGNNGASIARKDGDFDKMLKFVLSAEGGSKAHRVRGDRGGLTKKGITQRTYDLYRRQKGLSKQSVARMSDKEMEDIYYNMFYKASGADKIKDARLALYVFDTAVNMGVSRAKKLLADSNGSLSKFIQLRKQRYLGICKNNPSQNKFLKGWNNRLANLQNYANNHLT